MLAVPIPAYPNKSQYPVLAAPAAHIHILPATANSCPIRSSAAYPSDRWRWKWYNGLLKYKFRCDMPAPSANELICIAVNRIKTGCCIGNYAIRRIGKFAV